MTLLRLLSLTILGLLLQASLFAQRYNAGPGSGTAGNLNTLVGPFAGTFTTGEKNSFLGFGAGYANSTGYGNSFLGAYAGFLNTTGAQNSFLGDQAGYYNTTGSGNVFLGVQAGNANNAGSLNSFVGTAAGLYNTSGERNSFLGFRAGAANTSGVANSFLGAYAGQANTTGFSNCFLGAYAGQANTSGTNNSFVGRDAGYWTSTGGYNSFLGYQAGYANSTGVDNVFIGALAGYSNTTGKQNTMVGKGAGLATTTGYDNLFLGYQSGNKNTTGYGNAFVGAYAGFSSTTGYSNTLFGSQAGYKLTTSARNSFFGNFAGANTTYGSENVFLGRSAGENNVNGYFNVSIGNYAGPSLTNLQNASAIGHRARVSVSNALVLGSIKGINGAASDTRVGIRTTAPAYHLHVNGEAAKPGGGSWTVASDERLKREVTDFKDGLSVVEQIKPVWFRYNGRAGLPTEKKYVGVIAQQMRQVAPYTVGEFVFTDTTGQQEHYLDYDANALTYLLVNAVKELKQENVTLTELQQAKDGRIADLTSRLLQLEAAVRRLSGEPTAGSTAQLFQNEPNPTDGSAIIRYFLPPETGSAQLKVYSLTGVEVQSIDLSQKGNGQVSLSVGQLAAGEYVYHLLVEGQSIASKKLLLEK